MTPKQWKRLFYRCVLWGGITLGFVCLLFLGNAIWNLYGKEETARTAHTDAAEELQTLNERQAALSSNMQKLETPEGVDAVIRQTYPLAKPGEEVIVLTDNPDAASTSTPPKSLWQEFIGWFSW